MKILVQTPDYPDSKRENFAFVKQLVDEMALQGHSLQVVAPYCVSHNKRFYKKIEVVKMGKGIIRVYRPHYISFSNLVVKGFRPSDWAFKCAMERGLRMIEEKPDVIYGHFWSTAFYGYKFAEANNIPLFVASGESEIDFRNNSTKRQGFCDYVSGVICVSTKNLEESIRLNLTTREKCAIFPNAIDASFFRRHDKVSCRTRLGIPQGIFIACFLGWFNERKGSERLSQAISKIRDGKKIYSFFIGEGPLSPTCSNILFEGKLPHNQIPEYLNAADIFVLPTLQEGCCNAIIEAMACGLPIVSSNMPFNWDVLDSSNSIMVDPYNTDEIADAIRKLRDDKDLLTNLSLGALKKAEELTIDNRAKNILGFMAQKM